MIRLRLVPTHHQGVSRCIRLPSRSSCTCIPLMYHLTTIPIRITSHPSWRLRKRYSQYNRTVPSSPTTLTTTIHILIPTSTTTHTALPSFHTPKTL
jgi:hypothetical protein